MSYPFFIWTMQRTGGTSLTELLMDMSEYRKADHEPFNWRRAPRQFAAVARNWAESADEAALVKALAEIFAERYLIKHCYELHPELSFRLMEAAAKAGYRHLHLLRRDEVSRLMSKFVAEANGTWFKDYSSKVYGEIREGRRGLNPLPVKKIVAHYKHCRDMTDEVRKSMRDLGVEFREIYYEDLYVGERAARLRHLEQLLEFLGFNLEVIEKHRSSIEDKIFGSGQNTASVIRFVPNLQEVIDALVAAGCPAPPESFTRGSEFPSSDGGGGHADRGPPASRRGNKPVWQAQRRSDFANPQSCVRPLEVPGEAAPALVLQSDVPGSAIATSVDDSAPTLRLVLPNFGAVAGRLTLDEAEELFHAAAAAGSGCIVEVGSYRGRATLVLCAGSSVGARLPVYALDPHERSVSAHGTTFGSKDRAAFFRNFFRTELVEHVRLLNLTSSVVTPGWKIPVSLLFIAAARRYPSVVADFAAWQPHLIPGATVAFYDADAGGAKRVIEMLVGSWTLDALRQVGKLALFHFTGHPAPLNRRVADKPRRARDADRAG